MLDAPLVASRLGLYDACPISDGASALILVSESYADDHDINAQVEVTGTGQSSDSFALQERPHMARTPATTNATVAAFDQVDITTEDVDLLEVHDCYTIAEVLALEAMGFYECGGAIGAARRGETTAGGTLPVNLSGGLKAKGHPVRTTGVSQAVEVTRLLRGDHPRSDAVSDATVRITHNAGGTVASAVVSVLEVVA